MKISLIAAVARNGVIGRGNELPWRLPADLKRFKALTMGHTLIVGRKTFESIGRPLPGRTMVVISRRPQALPDGVRPASSVDEALGLAEGDELFIGGGAEIYRQTIGRADRLYLTRIDADFDGDTLFPEFSGERFILVERERHPPAGDTPFAFEFQIYDKR